MGKSSITSYWYISCCFLLSKTLRFFLYHPSLLSSVVCIVSNKYRYCICPDLLTFPIDLVKIYFFLLLWIWMWTRFFVCCFLSSYLLVANFLTSTHASLTWRTCSLVFFPPFWRMTKRIGLLCRVLFLERWDIY